MVHDFDRLRSWIEQPVQLIVLIDVIEHIPLEEHLALLSRLCSLFDGTGTVVLTYPALELQRERQESKAADLQLVDEIVELPHIEQLAFENGLVVAHYSLLDIWKEQYAHCVLRLVARTSEDARVEREVFGPLCGDAAALSGDEAVEDGD